MRLQFEPAGGNKWGSKQWRNSYATHFLFQVLTHYFSFWSLKFISNFQTHKQTACLQNNFRCQTHPRHYEYFKNRRRRPMLLESLHCESLPFAESDFNSLLRVISTLCWEWHHFEIRVWIVSLAGKTFKGKLLAIMEKKGGGWIKGKLERRMKQGNWGETGKLRMKKIPSQRNLLFSVQGRPHKVI